MIPFKQPAVLKSRQSGLSVVGLLIGVSISMVSILASLSLYTNHHISSSESMRGSTYNFQITQSMVIFNKEIPTAGFGLEDDGIDDIEVVPGTGTVSLYWRYDDGTVVCRGLREKEISRNSKPYRALSIIKAEIGCSDTEAFSTMTWETVATIAEWRVDASLAAYLADSSNVSGTLFEIAVGGAQVCLPYNAIDLTTVGVHPRVLITAPTLAQLSGNTTVGATSANICLPNLL